MKGKTQSQVVELLKKALDKVTLIISRQETVEVQDEVQNTMAMTISYVYISSPLPLLLLLLSLSLSLSLSLPLPLNSST